MRELDASSFMRRHFPKHFRCHFLHNICESFRKRSKSLNYTGKLDWETDPNDNFEWITISYMSGINPIIILQFWEHNRANIYIRSNRRGDRGKLLICMKDLLIVDNAKLLVSIFEKTIANIHGTSSQDKDVFLKVEEDWRLLAINTVD